jgi:acetoin utilization protein AcuB
MRVGEVMGFNVITVDGSASCHEAATRMFRGGLRHLPVVNATGALVGIITDRDLRHRLLAPAVLPGGARLSIEDVLKSTAVREVMSTPVLTASPSDDLLDAARTMLAQKIGSLPVVEGGRVVGIVTETDLLRRIVRSAECCCPDVPAIVVSFP